MVEAEVSKGVLETLGLNGKLFIAQLVNFSIVVFVMWKWVYRPLLKVMDERSGKIAKGLQDADESAKQLSEAQTERDRIVQEARGFAHEAIEDAKGKAEAVAREKMTQAKNEIEKVVSETKDQIRVERQAVYSTLQRETAELLGASLRKAFPVLDESAQRALITQAVASLEQK